VNKIVEGLKRDFPEIISVYSMGNTFEERPINVIELDAKSFLKNGTAPPKEASLVQYDFYSDNNEPEVKKVDELAQSLRDQVKQLRIKPLGETDDDSTLVFLGEEQL
jgi:hypothetical protein